MAIKYVTRATVDEYGEADDTGLLDAKGRRLLRIDEREPIGFGRPKR